MRVGIVCAANAEAPASRGALQHRVGDGGSTSRAFERRFIALCGVLALGCPTADEKPPAPSPAPEIAPEPDPGPAVEPGGGGLVALAQDTIEAVRAVPADPLALIPARARVLASGSPSALFAIPKFDAAFGFLLDKVEPKVAGVLPDLETCGLVPSQVESITTGGDNDGLWTVVVRGKGVGKPDHWRCARTMMVAASMEPDFELDVVGEQTVVRIGDDGGRFVDDDTVVLFDARWENEVTALISGKSQADVRGGELGKDILGRLPAESLVWYAATTSAEQQAALASSGYEGVAALWGALILADGFTLEASMLAGPTGNAETIRDAAREQWRQIESFAPAVFGVPATVMSGAEFETDGDVATLRFSATADEIEQVAAEIKGLL